MVRVLWLVAASVASVMVSGTVAESESETGRVRVVVRVHDHAKGILDVWETVKNETQEAIETVGDHIHDVLHGSESGEQDETVEAEAKSKTMTTNKHKLKTAVIKETIMVDHKVKKVKTLHGKSWLGDVLDDIKDAIYGSESGSGSAEVGQETVTEDDDEEEGGEIETPTPLEELTKKHAAHKSAHHKKTHVHHTNKKHAGAAAHATIEHVAKHTTKSNGKHAATAKKQQQHPATPHPAEAVTLSQSESEHGGHRMGETSFVVIGAAVGALVGVIALVVVAVVMRRRRSAATGASEATAVSQNDDDVETAVSVPVVSGENDDESLEGSV